MNADEPLELRDFVGETIKQVIDGVVIAQHYATTRKATVNPQDARYGKPPLQLITFDVAVTAAKETKTLGGIGVFIGPLGLGSKGQSEKTSESVNRIQFSIPVTLPLG